MKIRRLSIGECKRDRRPLCAKKESAGDSRKLVSLSDNPTSQWSMECVVATACDCDKSSSNNGKLSVGSAGVLVL